MLNKRVIKRENVQLYIFKKKNKPIAKKIVWYL